MDEKELKSAEPKSAGAEPKKAPALRTLSAEEAAIVDARIADVIALDAVKSGFKRLGPAIRAALSKPI